MSDLPSNDQAPDNSSQATSGTDSNENQTSDQMEQKIDAQIIQSIEEQQQQESQETDRPPDNSNQLEENNQNNNNEVIPGDQEPLPEDSNEPENEGEEEGPMLRIFNHRNVNILRVLNEMMAEDPVDLTDEDEDIDEDEDDPGK